MNGGLTSGPRGPRGAAALVLSLVMLPFGAGAQAGQTAQQKGLTGQGDLVTRDGQTITTRGTWRFEGGRVVYTDSRGVLSTVRLREIDLEATQRARAEAAANLGPAPEATGLRQTNPDRPSFVLDDRVIPRYQGSVDASNTAVPPEDSRAGVDNAARPASESAATADDETTKQRPEPLGASSAGGTPAGDAPPTPSPLDLARNLTVGSYRDLGDFDRGIELFGTVRNQGAFPVIGIELVVRVADELGVELGQGQARLLKQDLGAGEMTNFRIEMPEIRRYSHLDFELRSRARLAPQPPVRSP